MSYRYPNAMIKPGLNTLVAPTPIFEYGLWSWGNNQSGQLGLGNTTNYSSPKQVGALTNWSKIAGSKFSYFSLAIKTDGTLWSWGSNNQGQLGLGNGTYYSSPKQVGSLTNWSYVNNSGFAYTMAIKTDGTLWAWGQNNGGQLGQGNTTSRSSPVQIGSLTWIDCAAGVFNSFGIRSNYTLWVWGSSQGSDGECGTGTASFSSSSPVQIGSLTNWLKITAAQYSSYAIKTDGTLWAWGKNTNGRLGDGTTTSRSSPVQIGALTNWLSVSSAYASVIAVKTDGTLWGWGYNVYGELGLGNQTAYSSPKQIGALTNWASGNIGYDYFSVFAKTDGTLWAWGQNNFGQLGLGNTTNYSSPKQVGALTSWESVSVDRTNTLATISTSIFPYTQYGGIWRLNSASAAKGAGTWP